MGSPSVWRTSAMIIVLGHALGLGACGDDADAGDANPGLHSGGASSGSAGSDGSAGSSDAGATSSAGDAGAPSSNEGADAFLPAHESGSRLRAVSIGEPGEGQRLFQVWYDSELDTECSIELAEDGEYRCLPLGQDLAPGFLDADCSEPIFYDSLVVPCEGRRPFRRTPASEEACSGSRVIAMTEEAVDTVYHEACDGNPIELVADAEVWRDGEVLDPAQFLRVERVERANSAGFGVVEWVGEDGSRLVTEAFDAERGPCSSREFADGAARCTPRAAFLDGEWWFSEADCEGEQLAYAPKSSECLGPVEFALIVDLQGGGPTTLSRVEQAVTGEVYEQGLGADGMCTPRDSADLLWSLYPLGEVYDTDALFALDAVERGAGRLRVVHHAVDGVALNTTGLFRDVERGEDCTPVRAQDDTRICLPSSVARSEESAYSDASCSTPVLYSASDPSELVALVRTDFCVREGFAERVQGVYQTGASYTGPVYQRDDSGCTEVSSGDAPGYYELTNAEEEFGTLDERRE